VSRRAGCNGGWPFSSTCPLSAASTRFLLPLPSPPPCPCPPLALFLSLSLSLLLSLSLSLSLSLCPASRSAGPSAGAMDAGREVGRESGEGPAAQANRGEKGTDGKVPKVRPRRPRPGLRSGPGAFKAPPIFLFHPSKEPERGGRRRLRRDGEGIAIVPGRSATDADETNGGIRGSSQTADVSGFCRRRCARSRRNVSKVFSRLRRGGLTAQTRPRLPNA